MCCVGRIHRHEVANEGAKIHKEPKINCLIYKIAGYRCKIMQYVIAMRYMQS